MCSFQTSTGTLLMFLVDEKMGAAAVDEEEDEVALVFWRLGGGDVAPLLLPVVVSVSFVDIFLKEGVWSCFFNSGLTFLFIAIMGKDGRTGGRRYLGRIERKQE